MIQISIIAMFIGAIGAAYCLFRIVYLIGYDAGVDWAYDTWEEIHREAVRMMEEVRNETD